MRRISIIAATLLCCSSLYAQSGLESVLRAVESNNISLKAARMEQEAGEYENRSEILLDDPEFEFNYLWGAGAERRHDVRVSQSFDFGLISGQRSRLASDKNGLLALEYKAQRQDVLLEAEKTCVDLAYYNALEAELQSHLSNAEKLVAGYERKVELGESNSLELNNARLHLTNIKGEIGKIQIEKKRLQTVLQALNGGESISFTQNGFEGMGIVQLPSDFDAFFEMASEASPAIAYARKQIEVEKAQLKLDKTAWMPGLAVGYMSEISHAEAFRGLTLGVNIPLWRNASKVNQSKARYAASQLREQDAVQSFYHGMMALYNESDGLRSIAEDYRSSLDLTDNRALLLKAQEQGEISMIEYITEVDLYYENLEATLSAERDYHLILAELTSVLL